MKKKDKQVLRNLTTLIGRGVVRSKDSINVDFIDSEKGEDAGVNKLFFSPAVESKWPNGCEPLNSQENRTFSGAAASSRVRHFYCQSGTVAAVAVTAAAAGEE